MKATATPTFARTARAMTPAAMSVASSGWGARMSHSTLPGLSGRGDDRPIGLRSFASAPNAKCELEKAPDARTSVDDRAEHTTSAAANNAQRRPLPPTDRRSPAFKRPRLTLRTERRGTFPGPRAAPNRTPPRGRVRTDGGGTENPGIPIGACWKHGCPAGHSFLKSDGPRDGGQSAGASFRLTASKDVWPRSARRARRQSCAGLPTAPRTHGSRRSSRPPSSSAGAGHASVCTRSVHAVSGTIRARPSGTRATAASTSLRVAFGSIGGGTPTHAKRPS